MEVPREAPRTEPGGSGPTERQGAADVGPGSGTAETAASGSRLWPVAITVGLILVVLVNLAFIFIAVTGSDGVVESYNTEVR